MKELRCFYCRKYILPKFGNVTWFNGEAFCSYECASHWQDEITLKRKGIKCFLSVFILFVLLALFGLVESPNTSALQYKVTSIDLGFPTLPPAGGSIVVNTGISYDSTNFDSDPYTVYENYFFGQSSYSISQDPFYACQYSGSYFNSFKKDGLSGSTVKHLYSSFSYSLPYSSYDFITRCDYMRPYTSGSDFSYYFNAGSLPAYSFGVPNLSANLPYFFNVSGFYINADLKLDNGFVNTQKIDFSEIYGQAPYNLIDFSLNFGVDFNRVVGDLSSGQAVELNGSFLFDSDNPSSDLFSLTGSLPSYTFYIIGSSYYDSFSCDLSVSDNRSNSNEYPWELFYSCPGFLSHFYSNGEYVLALSFSSGSSSSVLWDYPATVMIYEGSYFVTDGDSTPSSDEFGLVPTGSGVPDSPGYPSHDIGDDTDWFSSLTNLFNFSFLNPFAPLFSMFSSNDSCANIPIIAGMLHSEETTYCPWFDSSTRNILTPVLSIVSVMLLFGFVVRWLGSSSGNMFEDQTVHKWNNTQFKQKGS